MYAFWKYDLFPYLLGGKAREIKISCNKNKDGTNYHVAYIESYSTWIKYDFLLDDEQGENLLNEINKAEKCFREEEIELKDRHKALFQSILDSHIGKIHNK